MQFHIHAYMYKRFWATLKNLFTWKRKTKVSMQWEMELTKEFWGKQKNQEKQ